jgi:hypothetical protein
MGRIERSDVAMSVGTLWQIADALAYLPQHCYRKPSNWQPKQIASPDCRFVLVSDDAMPRLCIADSVASSARADSEALL